MVFSICLFSCDKSESQDLDNIDVEKYIELLKSNKYDFLGIPAFSSNDIESLLEYRNDNTIINRFPTNLISSYAPVEPEYTIRVLVLWTIESIRVSSFNSENLMGEFPSQNPFLQTRKSPPEWVLDYNSEAYNVLSQVYYDWWENNKDKDFSEFKEIDPLSNTEYRWH